MHIYYVNNHISNPKPSLNIHIYKKFMRIYMYVYVYTDMQYIYVFSWLYVYIYILISYFYIIYTYIFLFNNLFIFEYCYFRQSPSYLSPSFPPLSLFLSLSLHTSGIAL